MINHISVLRHRCLSTFRIKARIDKIQLEVRSLAEGFLLLLIVNESLPAAADDFEDWKSWMGSSCDGEGR